MMDGKLRAVHRLTYVLRNIAEENRCLTYDSQTGNRCMKIGVERIEEDGLNASVRCDECFEKMTQTHGDLLGKRGKI